MHCLAYMWGDEFRTNTHPGNTCSNYGAIIVAPKKNNSKYLCRFSHHQGKQVKYVENLAR